MADEQPDKEERSEPASQRKLDEARKKGSVAKSHDLNSAAVLLLGFGVLTVAGGMIAERLGDAVRYVCVNAATVTVDRGSIGGLAGRAMLFLGLTLGPVLAAFMVIGFTANVAQVGLKFSPEALAPKWGRLNPFTGIKKVLISAHSAVELIKGLVKTIIVGLVAWSVVDDLIGEAVMLADSDVRDIARFLISATSEVVFKTGLAFAVIAAADYGYQKYEFLRNMRMTKQEVKDEFKSTEGDPQIKGRVRTIQRQIAYKRMMADVPKASVVVTNPTHFAVALRYEPGTMSAPKVVAKGADLIALRIREVARQHNVPIVEDKPLARALYKAADVGDDIPEKLFQAVAQILAYIYRLRTKNKPYRASA